MQYEKTHPWLRFQLDLRKPNRKFWMLLGEAQSKCDHIAGVPLQPATQAELHKVYLAKGAHATTAIEGNTLTEEQARELVEGTLDLPPSQKYLEQEVENIIVAYQQMLREIRTGTLPSISINRIGMFNRQVLENLSVDDHVKPGQVTQAEVVVGRYKGAPPQDREYLLERLCEWLGELEQNLKELHPISRGLIQAVLAHIYLVWIHPFGDGNGRTARLIESQILLSAGAPSPVTFLLSNHYNQTRTEYYRCLDKARKTEGGLVSFIIYALEGFIEGLQSQLNLISQQQLDISWRDYLRDQFRTKTSKGDVRRRWLIFDISEHGEIVPYNEISHVSPRIAEAYATLTKRTLMRDIAKLEKMGIIKLGSKGVSAHKDIMSSFLLRRLTDE